MNFLRYNLLAILGTVAMVTVFIASALIVTVLL